MVCMADKLQWGVLACGNIAHAFALGVAASRTGKLVASASRDPMKSEAFAKTHGGVAYSSYEELLADPQVDAVYIATPHHLHAEWTLKTAQAGKAILCEKPFTLNALEARKTLDTVRAQGVFFMEAFMYRCHPQTLTIAEWVRQGEIGRVMQVNAEFGFQAQWDSPGFRFENATGGGGLMDVGTYCVSMSRLMVGEEPERCHMEMLATERGYDASAVGTMRFPGGAVAHFGTGIHVNLRNDVRIYGDKGRIIVPTPWFCSGSAVRLERQGRETTETTWHTSRADLYAFEADAVADYLDQGECPYMSIQDTLDNMRALDMLRASCGFAFEGEVRA